MYIKRRKIYNTNEMMHKIMHKICKNIKIKREKYK